MRLRDQYQDMPSLLAAIRERPGMFLGRPTVSGLHLFLSGIWFSEDFQTAHHRLSGFDRIRFEQWIESRENPRRLSLSSFGLAAEIAGSDAAGFELWFEWYDQFTMRGSESAKNSESALASSPP